jgi:FkbM family methyltransferase
MTGPPNKYEVYIPHAGWLSFPPNDQVAVNLQEGWFECLEQAFLWLYARPGDVFVDCGAHVGLFTLIASIASGRTGRVLAIEPLAENVQLLRENIAANKLEGVDVVEAAAGSHAGRATLFRGRDGRDAWSTLFPPDSTTEYLDAADQAPTRDVPLLTLDSLVESHGLSHIAFVKIDAEGAEVDILAGFDKTLASRSIGVLMLEFTEDHLQRAGLNTKTLFDALAARDLTCCRFDLETRQLQPTSYEAPIDYENLFATFDVSEVNARLSDASSAHTRIAVSLLKQSQLCPNVVALRQQLNQAEQQHREMERQREEQQRRLQHTEQRLRRVEQQRQRAHRRLENVQKQLEHGEQCLEDVKKQRQKKERRRRQAEQRLQETEQRLQETEQKFAQAEQRLKETEQQHRQDQQELQQAEHGLLRANEQLAHACRRAEQVEDSLVRLRAAAADLRASQIYRSLHSGLPPLRALDEAIAAALDGHRAPTAPFQSEPAAPAA